MSKSDDSICCGNCQWFEVPPEIPRASGGNPQIGYCVEEPPKAFQTVGNVPGGLISKAGPQQQLMWQGIQPPTSSTRRCSHFQRKEQYG